MLLFCIRMVKEFMNSDQVYVFSTHPEERVILEQTIQSALQWKFIGPRPSIFEDAENVILKTHKLAVEQLCENNKSWSRRLNLIGFHGQTVLHHPPKAGTRGQTLQLGNGEKSGESTQLPRMV